MSEAQIEISGQRPQETNYGYLQRLIEHGREQELVDRFNVAPILAERSRELEEALRALVYPMTSKSQDTAMDLAKARAVLAKGGQ